MCTDLATALLVVVLGRDQHLDRARVGVDELVGADEPLQLRRELVVDLWARNSLPNAS